MQVGYNTNVSYKGTVYHVQTEDNGTSNPVIVTLLYVKGTILSAKRTNYADVVNDPDSVNKIRELMKEQHKAMIKELIAGKHAAPPAPAEAAQPAETKEPAPKENTAPPPTEQKAPQAEDAPPSSQPPETEKPEKKGQISRSLDDILLDYIMKDEGKTPE